MPAFHCFSRNSTLRLIAGEKWAKLRVHLSSDEGISEAMTINHNGTSALHYACRFHPPLDIVQTFVEKCACSACAQDSFGRTALHIAAAARRPSLPIIQYLLKHNSQAASMVDVNGKTPLILSVTPEKRGRCVITDLEIVVALCDAARPSVIVEDSFGMTALEYAIIGNADADLMRFLMRMTKNERLRNYHERQKQVISPHLNVGQIQAKKAANAA